MTLLRSRLTSALFFALLVLSSVSASARHKRVRSRFLLEPRIAEPTTVMRGRASWYGKYFQGRRTTSGERFNRFEYTCAHKTLPFNTRLRVTNVANGEAVVVRVTDRGPFRHRRIIDLAEIAAKHLDVIEKGAVTVIAEVMPADTPLGPTDAPENLVDLRAADPAPRAPFVTFRQNNVPELKAEEAAPALIAETAGPAATVAPTSADATDVAPATDATVTVAVAPLPITYIIQAGAFDDLGNARAMEARIEALDERLRVALQAETINGRQLSRVVVGDLASRAEAEAVRARLRVWGIGGMVREVAVPRTVAAANNR